MSFFWRPTSSLLMCALLVACCAIPFTACVQRSADSAARPMSADHLEDSLLTLSTDTTYRRRVGQLAAQSRAVPIDSLARMYAAMPTASVAQQPALRQGATCELSRLSSIYGGSASELAYQRMQDSLALTGIDPAAMFKVLYEGAGPPLEVSKRTCPNLPRHGVPDSLEMIFRPS